MYVPDLSTLVGDEDTFFSHHHNRAPLLRTRALPVDPRQLLSIADLDDLLYSEAIRPPYLRIIKGGRQVIEATYTTTMTVQGEHVTGCVVPERVLAHFRSGATLTWNALNHHRPNLRALAAALTETFATTCDIIAFLSPADGRGLTAHYDPVDVFVVQLEGTKLWKVWLPPTDRRGDKANDLDPDQLGPPAINTTLQPGDVLYLPYGSAHLASSTDTVSLHLSLTVQPRRWADLLRQTVARLLDNDDTFLTSPHLTDHATTSPAAELRAMCDTLCERLANLDTQTEITRLITAGHSPRGTRQATPLTAIASADHIGPHSRIRRRPDTHIDITPDGAHCEISVGRNTHTMPASLPAALTELAAGHTRTASTLLPDTPPQLCLSLTKTLVRLGILEPLDLASG